MNRTKWACAVLAAAIALAAPLAAAQDKWPSKQIRIVSPLAPGGPVDLLARTLAAGFQERYGVAAIVENISGGNGVIGMDNARRAPADGHTLVVAPSGYLTINPTLMTKLPYSIESDFAPVSMLAKAPNLMVAHPKVGASSVKEIVAAAKAKPGSLAFASPGVGSGLHLAGELFKQQTGTDLVHVPYKGTGPALNDVLAGHVPLMFGNLHSLLPHVRSGKLRAIGVTDTARAAAAPDIPTLAEQGASGVVATSWYGLLAPGATPNTVVATLSKDVSDILGRPATRAQFEKQGLAVWILPTDTFREHIRSEAAGWARIIKERNIVAE
jgi:tripartite-type tricarboxylate transporter receptor subunit TctC